MKGTWGMRLEGCERGIVSLNSCELAVSSFKMLFDCALSLCFLVVFRADCGGLTRPIVSRSVDFRGRGGG